MCKCVFLFCISIKYIRHNHIERSKRPHQSKRPGAIKIAKTRLGFLLLLKNAPRRSFSRFFERKAPWGEPTTREGVRKGPAAEAERDASQHAVGGIARVSSFLSIFLDQFKLFF